MIKKNHWIGLDWIGLDWILLRNPLIPFHTTCNDTIATLNCQENS